MVNYITMDDLTLEQTIWNLIKKIANKINGFRVRYLLYFAMWKKKTVNSLFLNKISWSIVGKALIEVFFLFAYVSSLENINQK